MRINEILQQFLETLSSQNTFLSYKNDLTQFLNFCTHHAKMPLENPAYITETICVMWRHHLQNTEEVHNRTLARKLAALSAFLKFCKRKKIITTNPLEFFTRPKVSKEGQVNILTKEEWEHVYHTIENQIKYSKIHNLDFQYKLWKKRHTILFTLFTVGMRVEELCQLKFEDLEKINDDIYRLHLKVKGNTKHAPLIHKKTALVLLDYMKEFNISQNGQSIFQNIGRSHVCQMVKLCVAKAGITIKVSPHSLRASLATHLHQKGVQLTHIQELLHHKNIGTTLLYTRVSDKELHDNACVLEEEF